MRTRGKVLATTGATVALVLGGAGAAYATHYQDRALPGSTVGTVSVAGMTRAEVAEAVGRHADDLTVTVKSGGHTRTAHLTDLGYDVDVDATVDAVFGGRTWSSYATSLVSPRTVGAVVETDEEAVDATVADLVGKADKVGRDATVSLSPKKTSFVVEPAVVGATVVPASFQDVVVAAARDLAPATATVEFADTTPKVTTEQAQQVADAANALVERKVVVSDGTEEHVASTKTKASWVTVPTSGDGLGEPSVDEAKVKKWVGNLATEADTEPVTGMRYVTSSGTVLRVMSNARDGRQVTNAADLGAAAVAALAGGKSWSGSFDYKKLPASWNERRVAAGAEKLAYPAAEGEKWIDVNLSRHTMTAYVGAKVVKGPVAMVDGGPDFPTSTGLFHIYLKNPLMTMRGTNADGSDYETEDVPWSSFFTGGIALHGAYWRDSFGYSGSHGCVNLPVDVAKWVYDFAPIGTPVASHR
jgi:hypothetical protein